MNSHTIPTQANLDKLLKAMEQCYEAEMYDQHAYVYSLYVAMLAKLN